MDRVSERVVERIVRSHFERDPAAPLIEDQISSDDAVYALLLRASKNVGTGGPGRPEFIISSPAYPFLIIVECKVDRYCFRSHTLDKPMTHAVDGAIHYARALSQSFNVVAIGVAGIDPTDMSVGPTSCPGAGRWPPS